MPSSSLDLSSTTEQRIRAAAQVLRVSPDAFLQRLLAQYFNTVGGLPLELLRYIISFLDYSTISALIARVSKFWQDCVLESPQNFFSRLRQMHGIHLLDPVHGMFYFPRALKRVVFETKATSTAAAFTAAAATGATTTTSSANAAAAHIRRSLSPAAAASTLHANAQTVPASSFLTVDIRTQNTKSLPWGYVQVTVQRAIEQERADFGAVRTPGLQRPEEPVWSQAATVTYDRRIYMFGGETYEGVVLDRAYEYDPMTKHWAVLPSLYEKRAAASAAAFQGRIFVFGGYNEEGTVLDTYEVLDVATRSWVSRHYPPSWLFESDTHGNASATSTYAHPPLNAKWPRVNSVFDSAATPTATTTTTTTAAAGDGVGSIYSRLLNVSVGVSAGMYRMPEKVCGTATAVHGDVIIFAGGHRSCIAPDQTAVSYSAMNSASTTPMHSVGGPYAGMSNGSAAGTPSPALGGSSARGAQTAAAAAGGSGANFMAPSMSGEPTPVTLHTPVHGGFESITSPTGVTNTTTNGNTNASTRTNSPRRLPRVNSLAMDGPATAETLVWVFSPRTGQWWRHGPRLPTPRAFGALAVLELPILGPCLCYFGGCAKADAPETAMFYIPLCDARHTRVNQLDCPEGKEDKTGRTFGGLPSPTCAAAAAAAATPSGDENGEKTFRNLKSPTSVQSDSRATVDEVETAGVLPNSTNGTNFLRAAQEPWPTPLRDHNGHLTASSTARGVLNVVTATPSSAIPATYVNAAVARAVFSHPPPHTPTMATNTNNYTNNTSVSTVGSSVLLDDDTPLAATQAPTGCTRLRGVDMILRCFRDPEELPWQRYVRIPIGGAFTSVAVLGHPHSRTVVVTGFYPAPNIGFCKVNHLLPPDAFTPLMNALSPSPPPPPPAAAEDRLSSPVDVAGSGNGEGQRGLHTPPQQSSRPSSGGLRYAPRTSPPPPLQLDPALQDEAAAAALHFHQEREWSHHQRQEVREMVRSVARAATLRHPRNPQTAGEERKWSLAPVPEVRVRNATGPVLTRVSWKVQSLNAKVIVGIE